MSVRRRPLATRGARGSLDAFRPGPLVLVLGGLLVVAVAMAAVGALERSAAGAPLLIGGLALAGCVALGWGLVGLRTLLRAGQRGDGRTAFFAALLGGLCLLAGAAGLAGALVLWLLSQAGP